MQENQLDDAGECPVYGATGISGYTYTPQCTIPSILVVKDGSGAGSVKYVSGNYAVIGTLNYLIPKQDIDLDYIYHVLKTFSFEAYKTGMAIPHIYFRDYGKALIYYPNKEDRDRIKIPLSLLERKLDVECQNIEMLRNQKRFILNNLFI